jgi:hypothetical protein
MQNDGNGNITVPSLTISGVTAANAAKTFIADGTKLKINANLGTNFSGPITSSADIFSAYGQIDSWGMRGFGTALICDPRNGQGGLIGLGLGQDNGNRVYIKAVTDGIVFGQDAGIGDYNVYIRNLFLGDKLYTNKIFLNNDKSDGNQIFTSNNKSMNIFSDHVFISGNLTALNGGFRVINDIAGSYVECNKIDIKGSGGYISSNEQGVLNFPMYVYVQGVRVGSDYRLKDNVRDINEFTTLCLRPVQYKLKKNNDQAIGLIAHELQEHIPILVNGKKDAEEMQSVDYIGLIPVLIKDIQRLNQKIIDNDAKSESRISNLESRISNLESRIIP